TFSVTLITAGSRSARVADVANPSLTGTATVTVNPAAATGFQVNAVGTATAGTPFSSTLTAQDPFGNTATGYAGTVHFSSSDGQGVLPSDARLSNGTGNFTVNLKTPGIQTVTA